MWFIGGFFLALTFLHQQMIASGFGDLPLSAAREGKALLGTGFTLLLADFSEFDWHDIEMKNFK